MNGAVKAKYRAREELLLNDAEGSMVEQALKMFAMASPEDTPKASYIPTSVKNFGNDKKREIANKILFSILTHYQYANFDTEQNSLFKAN